MFVYCSSSPICALKHSLTGYELGSRSFLLCLITMASRPNVTARCHYSMVPQFHECMITWYSCSCMAKCWSGSGQSASVRTKRRRPTTLYFFLPVHVHPPCLQDSFGSTSIGTIPLVHMDRLAERHVKVFQDDQSWSFVAFKRKEQLASPSLSISQSCSVAMFPRLRWTGTNLWMTPSIKLLFDNLVGDECPVCAFYEPLLRSDS